MFIKGNFDHVSGENIGLLTNGKNGVLQSKNVQK